MNSYFILPLVLTFSCILLATIVLRQHSRSSVHRLFFLFLLAVATWGVLIFGMRRSPDIEHAYLWEKWLIPAACFMSVLFYHFSLKFTTTRIRGWILLLLYFPCFILIPIAATRYISYIITGMQIRPYGYAPVLGSLAPLFLSFNYAVSIAALLVLIGSYKRLSSAESRNRLVYIITGLFLTFIGGAFDVLPILGLPLYPGAIIANLIFCLLVSLAIVRHNLLDAQIVLRKGVAYVSMSAIIASPFVGFFLITNQFFVGVTVPLWAYFLVLLILALVVPQLWQKTQQKVDRWFYRDRYDHLRALEILALDTHSVMDSAKLGSTLVNLIGGALRTKSVFLLQKTSRSGDFHTAACLDINNLSTKVTFKKQSPLLEWLEQHDDVLSWKDLNSIPQLQGIIYADRDRLQKVGADIVVPLKTRAGLLSGVLILGQRTSKQPYSIDDKRLIHTISSHIAMTLENIQLYSDAVRVRENLEAWLNSMSDCVLIIHANYTIQFANEAAVDKFGIRVGQNCWDGLGNEAKCLGCPMEYCLRNAKGTSHHITRARGRDYDAAVASMVSPDGNVSLIEVFRDITERKEAEEREKQQQEEVNLSSRLASIGELVAGIAHEINNPLTGIVGFSERLLRRSVNDETREELQVIHDEAKRAANVVQNLRTFARRREQKKEYSNINDIVQRTLELRAYELKTSNIEVVTDLAPGLPEISVDSQQIQQVFLNIIVNAEQAMSEANRGGKLHINTEKTRGNIRASITDDGPGVPAEQLNKIFDPFFTSRGERGGTGLGLSVCHGIVAEHRGRIYVKSKPEKGATFFVELPVTTEEMDESRVAQKEHIHRGK